MAFDASELYTGFAPIRASHVKQFFDALTGVMTDQPITIANVLALTSSTLAYVDVRQISAPAAPAANYNRLWFQSDNILRHQNSAGTIQEHPGISVTTAGDIIYATAADTLTRLGITAGGYLKGNAAGTAPEYSPAGQIVFPATQNASADANTLDDYEEGTWTPSVGGTATYLNQVGKYTKIGRLVTALLHVEINAIGTGSTTTLTGAPFAPSLMASCSVGLFTNSVTAFVFLAFTLSGTTFTCRTLTAAAASVGSDALFGAFTELRTTCVYEV